MTSSDTPLAGSTIQPIRPENRGAAAGGRRGKFKVLGASRAWRYGLCILCVVAASGCLSRGAARTAAAGTARHAEELRQAGERLGVPVRTAQMVELADGGAELVAAPAIHLETIPATRYPAGIDLGVAYLDLPRPVVVQGSSNVNIQKGFYKLRAFTEEGRQTGRIGGHAQLIDAAGGIVADLPAEAVVQCSPSGGGGQALYMKKIPGNSVLICGETIDGMTFCLRFTQARYGNGITVSRG
jgi:hypothetical protein